MWVDISEKRKTDYFSLHKTERETVTSEVLKKNIPGPAWYKTHDQTIKLLNSNLRLKIY